MDLEKFIGDTRITDAVYKVWEERAKAEKPRGHLGASEIGEECERKLWLGFRRAYAKSFPGSVLRLFDRGKREEAVVYAELAEAGMVVTGTQDHGIAPFGHFGGSCDGVVAGVPGAEIVDHVLEIKTHSRKFFDLLVKNAVEKAMPKHYAQMQVYMRFFKKTRALYYAVNKDNDGIYTERLRENKAFQDALLAKAEHIIFAAEPPPRIASTPSDFRCKLCDASNVCWRYELPVRHCRNCCNATPERMFDEDNTCPWKCDAGRFFGTVCGQHLFVPPIVSDSYEMRDDGCVWHSVDGKSLCDCPHGCFPAVDDGHAPDIMPRDPEKPFDPEIPF
jgi:hypothetical protein